MSSNRIRAAALLINALEAEARRIPCDGVTPCACRMILLICDYRSEFQTQRALNRPVCKAIREVAPCPHLLAPLQLDPDLCARLDVPNYRKCSRCDAPLWDDGSPMAYLGEDDARSAPPKEGPNHPRNSQVPPNPPEGP